MALRGVWHGGFGKNATGGGRLRLGRRNLERVAPDVRSGAIPPITPRVVLLFQKYGGTSSRAPSESAAAGGWVAGAADLLGRAVRAARDEFAEMRAMAPRLIFTVTTDANWRARGKDCEEVESLAALCAAQKFSLV